MDFNSFQRAGLLLLGRSRLGLGFREGTGESRSMETVVSGKSKRSKNIDSSRRASNLLEWTLDDCMAALAAAFMVSSITESTVSSS